MPTRDRRSRRPRLWSEALESRRMLVATPINVAAGLTFALAAPLPGLATGQGMATTAQTLPTATASVAPVSVAAPIGPMATGPAPTLSPLPNDSETAAATASEVARPTPGRSDRISSFVEAPEVVEIEHLRPIDADEVIPGPEVQAPPAPAPIPAEPAAPAARPVEVAPPVAPVPPPPVAIEAAPEDVVGGMTALEAWDASIDLLATNAPEASPTRQAGEMLAAGALLAAWGGWRYGPRSEGRSRRKPMLIVVVEDGR